MEGRRLSPSLNSYPLFAEPCDTTGDYFFGKMGAYSPAQKLKNLELFFRNEKKNFSGQVPRCLSFY